MSTKRRRAPIVVPLQPRSSETVIHEKQAQEQGFFCSICYCLCDTPTRVSLCENHFFCKDCLQPNESGIYRCPECRTESARVVLSKTLSKVIECTLVKCMNTPLGCGWTGTQRDARDHLKNHCSHREESRKCEYCHLQIPGLMLEWHQSYECPGAKDIPRLNCSKRKAFASHVHALHHDENHCSHSHQYICKGCRRQQCEVPNYRHVPALYAELQALKHYVESLHADENKTIEFKRSYQITLDLRNPRVHTSLVATSFESTKSYGGPEAHYGVQFKLQDQTIHAYFYLKDYNTLYFKIDCPRRVSAKIEFNGKSKSCKSLLLSKRRLHENRELDIKFTCTYQSSPKLPPVSTVEPRILLLDEDIDTTRVKCETIGKTMDIPEFDLTTTEDF